MILLSLCLGACVTFPKKEDGQRQDHFLAEYHLMKTNLNLLKRENEVINAEILQYKQENRKQKGQVDLLTANLKATQERYDKELTDKQNQIQAAKKEHDEFEKQAESTIAEMTATYQALEKKLIREKEALNRTIKRQKRRYAAQKQAFLAKAAQAKKACDEQFAALNKKLAERGVLLKGVEKQLAESQSQLGLCQKTVDAYQARAAKLQKLLEEQKAKFKIMDQQLQGIIKKSSPATNP